MNLSVSRTAVLTLAAVLPLAPLCARAAEQTQGITLAQESPDQWRASKLVGLRVYGPDNKSVGKITDVLVGKDGRAQDVIIGVGGFLGIGEKDVAVPFTAVNFSDQPVTPPAMGTPDNNNLAAQPAGMNPPGTMAPAAGGMAAANGVAANGGMAPATPGLGTPADMTNNGGAGMMTPADAMPHSAAYPDHAVIAFNVDQLKSAPSFQFAK